MSDDAHDDHKLTAAGRVLALLGVFSEGTGAHTLSEISRQSGLSLTTTHRLLREISAWGGLEIDDAGRYRLGTKILGLASSSTRGMRLREKALPYLGDLHRRTGLTTHLAVRDGHDVMYLDALRVHPNYGGQNRIGGHLPLHATGTGLVLLAYADPDVVDDYARQSFRQYTPHTIADAVALRRALAVVREHRHAVAPQAVTLRTGSIAAPVFDADGAIEASVGVVYAHGADVAPLVQLVRSTAARVSRTLLETPSKPSPVIVEFQRRHTARV